MSSTRKAQVLRGMDRLGQDRVAQRRVQCGAGHQVDGVTAECLDLASQTIELEEPDRASELVRPGGDARIDHI